MQLNFYFVSPHTNRHDPEERMTAPEALQHPFLRGVSVN